MSEELKDEQFRAFYGLLRSKRFDDLILKLKIYAIFLEEKIFPYEDPDSTHPTHKKREEIYLEKKKEAEEVLKELQLMFAECDFDDFKKIKEIVKIIPIGDGSFERRKCKSLLQDLYREIFKHDFTVGGLVSTICGFGHLSDSKKNLIELFDNILLKIFQNECDVLFKQKTQALT